MLATRRPRMGSSFIAGGAGPFGCRCYNGSYGPCVDINNVPDCLPERQTYGNDMYLMPPDPPPGNPLLSPMECTNINSTIHAYLSGRIAIGEAGITCNGAWTMPPSFVGTATSFGPQPPFPASAPGLTGGDDFLDAIQYPTEPTPPTISQQRAPMRASNGHQFFGGRGTAVHSNTRPNGTAQSNAMRRGSVVSSQALGHPTAHILSTSPNHHFNMGSSSPMPGATRASPMTPLSDRENILAHMSFGNPYSQATGGIAQPHGDVTWGTDCNFVSNAHFMPPSPNETTEMLESHRNKVMDCLQLNSSAASTQPPSPLGSESASPGFGLDMGHLDTHAALSDQLGAPPVKRRTSKAQVKADEEDCVLPIVAKSAAKKRKSYDSLVGSNEVSLPKGLSGKKRRKSNNSGAKPPKENLSEEAKVRRCTSITVRETIAD